MPLEPHQRLAFGNPDFSFQVWASQPPRRDIAPSFKGALASVIRSPKRRPQSQRSRRHERHRRDQGNRGASAYAPEPTRRLAADLIETTLTEAGRHFSDIPRGADEIEAYASAMSDMFCAYLTALRRS